jgi:hypothetical protein
MPQDEPKFGIDVHFSDSPEGTKNLNALLKYVSKPFLVVKLWVERKVLFWNLRADIGGHLKLYDPNLVAVLLKSPDFQGAVAEAARLTNDPQIAAVAANLSGNVG